MISMACRKVLRAVVAPNAASYEARTFAEWKQKDGWFHWCAFVGVIPPWFWSYQVLKLTRFVRCENRGKFGTPYLPIRHWYCNRTCTTIMHFSALLDYFQNRGGCHHINGIIYPSTFIQWKSKLRSLLRFGATTAQSTFLYNTIKQYSIIVRLIL